MKGLGIEFDVIFQSWSDEWDDYDLEALELVAWQETLGGDADLVNIAEEMAWDLSSCPFPLVVPLERSQVSSQEVSPSNIWL